MTKSVKPLPELKNRVLSPKQSKFPHFVAGAWGEKQAVRFLLAKGYRILATNLSFKNYELDIIALDPDANEIVFVEVKTRRTDFFGLPSGAVNRLKLRSLNRAASAYLKVKGLRNLYRFDIIAVTPGKMEHFENVTWP